MNKLIYTLYIFNFWKNYWNSVNTVKGVSWRKYTLLCVRSGVQTVLLWNREKLLNVVCVLYIIIIYCRSCAIFKPPRAQKTINITRFLIYTLIIYIHTHTPPHTHTYIYISKFHRVWFRLVVLLPRMVDWDSVKLNIYQWCLNW